MTTEAVHGARAGNLFLPVPGKFASHGRFDRRARSRSVELWLTKHRAWFVPLSALALGAALTGYLQRRA
jgi:hypothetical protein